MTPRLTPWILALAVLLVALPARADDDSPEQVHMRFVERGDYLTVTTKLSKLFDSAAYDALDSGFPSTVVIQMYVYPQGSNEPVAGAVIERSCVYDLWDENYTIQITTRLSDGSKPTVAKLKVNKHAEALQTLTNLDDFTIVPLSAMPFDQIYQLGVVGTLNPVSKETLAEVRRWLSQGTGGGLDRGGTFFGSFVSVFVNSKLPEADRVVRLNSQPFFRPKP